MPDFEADNLVKYVVDKKVRAKCAEIEAAETPEVKMEIALRTIYGLLDFVGERPAPEEEHLWCDLWEIVGAATKLLTATALEPWKRRPKND